MLNIFKDLDSYTLEESLAAFYTHKLHATEPINPNDVSSQLINPNQGLD